MMKIKLTLLLSIGFLISSAQEKYQLTKIWETDTLAIPESVLPLKKEKILFVSLIEGGIAKISPEGKIIDANWVTGLNAPKGLGISKGKLYTADLKEVVVVDIATGKVERKIQIPGAVGLNDITVDPKNNIYVSDSKTGNIFKLQNDVPSLYISTLKGTNGLKALGTDLYIGAGPELWKADAQKKLVKIAEGFESGLDGIEFINSKELIVTCWTGLIYTVHLNGTVNKLMDTRGVMNTADIHFDQAAKILYLPTFNKKSIIAYKLQK